MKLPVNFAIIEFSDLSTFIKYFNFYKTRFIFYMSFSFFKGALMQIWKSPYIFKLI